MTKNGIIENYLDVTQYAETEEVCIRNCIIEELFLGFVEFTYPVVIENCIIGTIGLHSTWFTKGLTLRKCVIRGELSFEEGENRQTITIQNNVFMEPFVFWDCCFYADVIVEENIFCKGCSLLDTSNYFVTVGKCKRNIGSMDMESELTQTLSNTNSIGTIGFVEYEGNLMSLRQEVIPWIKKSVEL